MSEIPRTPSEDKPELIGFEKQDMVSWFGPRLLGTTGMQAVLASLFGKYADNREVQAATPAKDPYTALARHDEVWIDYIADLGDGFNPTYTMARLLAEPEMELEWQGEKYLTRRGHALVMGGDQVYPVASRDEYQNRMTGPYRAALPWVHDEAKAPVLFAIPGNHDWYDGLVSFSRVFRHGRWIGGWKTCQDRSYFAVELCCDWWVWGIDIALDEEIDEAQLKYFADIASNMRQGSRIILCTAEPSWTYVETKGEKAYRNLGYFEENIIRKYGHALIVGLAGDLHTYARYTDVNGILQRFICGGGGAYLYPTHDLPTELCVPELSKIGEAPAYQSFRVAPHGLFPKVEKSRELANGALRFVSIGQNWKFSLVLGVLYFIVAWVLQSTGKLYGRNLIAKTGNETVFDTFIGGTAWVTEMIFDSPGIFLLLFLIMSGLMAYADPPRPKAQGSDKAQDCAERKAAERDQATSLSRQYMFLRMAMGGAHYAAHSFAFVLSFWLTANIIGWASAWIAGAGAAPFWLPYFQAALFVAGTIAIGGLLAGSIFGLYLWLANRFLGAHSNDVFSCQGNPDYKSFLRLHIDKSGTLTIYPIGVDKVCQDFKLNTAAQNGEAWFEPAQASICAYARLIEPPIRLR